MMGGTLNVNLVVVFRIAFACNSHESSRWRFPSVVYVFCSGSGVVKEPRSAVAGCDEVAGSILSISIVRSSIIWGNSKVALECGDSKLKYHDRPRCLGRT
jgi:hypothetical protein